MLIKMDTFKKNLLLFLVPLLIPLLTLGAFAIVITRHYIQDEINKNNFKILQQTQTNLELIFDELDSLNLNLGINPEIVIALKKIFDTPESRINYEQYRFLKIFINSIEAPANARPYIHSIYLYFDNNQQKFLSSNKGLTALDDHNDYEWYRSYLQHKSSADNYWSEIRSLKDYQFLKEPTEVWTIYRKIYATTGFQKCIGVIALNIYTDYLLDHLFQSETKADTTFLILDASNRLVFSRNPDTFSGNWLAKFGAIREQSFIVKFNRTSYAAAQIYSEKYRLRYISIIPLKTLNKIPFELQKLTLLLLAVSFGLGLLLTYYLTRKNHNQVKDIVALIDSATQGCPLPDFPASIRDEYSYITHNILRTFIEQNYLKTQLSERKYRLQFMELLALQSQINPHFLFNTLETIKWKVIQYTVQPNEAGKMIENLADILQYSLESPGKKVTVEDEISNTRNYIGIQKIRYSDKFDIIWQYDEEVKRLSIIRLVFQPLIENAIYHGIKEKDGQSLIKIKIRQKGPMVKICIIDNGVGIPKERLNRIKYNLSSDNNEGSHIGLYNTNKRLTLTYGPSAALHIRSKVNFGTVVFFQIPTA